MALDDINKKKRFLHALTNHGDETQYHHYHNAILPSMEIEMT